MFCFTHIARWPGGTYAIPMPVSGCPRSKRARWSEGSLQQNTEDTSPLSNWSRPIHLKGRQKNNEISQHFCVKENKSGSRNWPAGKYCIYKKGKCPYGKNTPYSKMAAILIFFCLHSIFLNFEPKNEARRAYLNTNKRILIIIIIITIIIKGMTVRKGKNRTCRAS